MGLLAVLAAAAVLSGLHLLKPSVTNDSDVIPVYTYAIVNIYPHDRDAFTQGLVFDDGVLYEGTGLFGHSTLRRVDLETGAILAG